MSDNIDLKIHVDAATTGTDKLEAQRREFDKLEAELLSIAKAAKVASTSFASLARGKVGFGAADDVKNGRAALDLDRARYGELRKIFAFQRRMGAQEKRENDDLARQFQAQEKAKERALQDQARAAKRAAQERSKAEEEAEKRVQDSIRATTRLRDRENRKAIQDADRLRRAQDRAAQRVAQGASQAHSGANRVATGGAAAAAVMGYGGARAIGRGLSSRMQIDTSETNLKIFNETDDGKGDKRKITDADIRKLRRGPKGLDAEAIRNGVSISAAIDAYNEVAKAGLIDPMEQTKTLLAGTTALELDPRAVTKLMGTMSRNMGADATPARNRSVLNALAVGAREDPTQANEIVEGMNRAQGILGMTQGLTEEDLVALVSGGQSVGIQPGKAGTFLPALARDILQGNNKFLDKGKRKELNFAAKHLGFGNAKNMATQFAGKKGKEVLYQIFGNLKAMDPALRAQVASALSGGQWGDEDLQMVNGLDGMISTDKAIHDPKNANFLDDARNTKMKSWAGMWAQSQAIFSLFWESFGVGFDGILREINAFFLDLNGKFSYDQVSDYVRQALDGLREGLGLQTWTEGLKAIFPSDISGLGTQIKDFAKGFGDGLRSVGAMIKSVASMFGVGSGAESIGRLAGQFLLLSTAAVALSPVIGLLGGLAGIIMGVAGMARAAMSILGMGGGAAVGGLGGGAVAGALASVARLLSGGFILSLAGAIGSLRGEIVTMMIDAVKPLITALWEGLRSAFSLDGLKAGGSALLDELIPAPLKRWLDGDKATPTPGQGTDAPTAWVDPPDRTGSPEKPAAETPAEKLRVETEKQTQLLQEQLRVQQEALQLEKAKELADAAKRSAGSAGAAVNDAMRQAPALAGSVGSGPLINSSTPGGSLNGIPGMRRRGIIGGGGGGGGAGGGSSSPAPDGGSDPIPGALNPRLAGSRKSLMDELDRDPALRRDVLKTASMENRGSPMKMQTVLESMVNRAKMNGYSSLRQAIHSGFYGPVNRGGLRGALSEKDRLDGEAALKQVKNGSNIIGYRTDQGMLTDPGARRYMREADHSGHKVIGGENYFWMGQKGRQWAKQQEALDAAGGNQGPAGAAKAEAEKMKDLGSDIGSNGKKAAEAAQKTGDLAKQAKPKKPGSLGVSSPAQDGAISAPGAGLGSGDAAGSAPTRTLGSDAPLSGRSPGGAGAGNSGRVGHNINTQIHINGQNKSPDELANTVQRKIQDDMNRRVHDYDGFA